MATKKNCFALFVLVVSVTLKCTTATSSSSRVKNDIPEGLPAVQERRVRGTSATNSNNGPRRNVNGGVRRLQEGMGVSLSEGYGGSSGMSERESSTPMRDSSVPLALIVTPPTAPAVPVTPPASPPIMPPTFAAPFVPGVATVTIISGSTSTQPPTTQQPVPVLTANTNPSPTFGNTNPSPTFGGAPTGANINPSPTFGAGGGNVTFVPGQLTVMERDLILSQGLTSKTIAVAGMPVLYANGQTSQIDFHMLPDGAGCFPDNRASNAGGWICVSNAEDKQGGVGALTFNKDGGVIDYRMVLENTVYNCNGGKTPWDTWISCEEDFDKMEGRPWQVDPYGVKQPVTINMGLAGGSYEAFAFDVRNQQVPRFFLTEDSVFGALERFTPVTPNWQDPWAILLGSGVNEWLLLEPNPTNPDMGTYSWTTDLDLARSNAAMHYPETEGVECAGSNLYFVTKGTKKLYTLDLDGRTYNRQSTEVGLMEGDPDMIRSLLMDEPGSGNMLFFTEDDGRRAGIHARTETGELLTILEGFYKPETTGLSFSPNKMFMYVCFQEDGYCFAISRTDGLSFGAKFMNLKSNPTEVGKRKRKTRR